MGSWFTRYFQRLGHHVSINDIDRRSAKQVSAETSAEIREIDSVEKREFDVIFLSVPIKATIPVIRAIGRRKLGPKILAEITSLKLHTAGALRRVSQDGCEVVSLHPLFGPGAKLTSRLRFAFLPVRNGAKEREAAKSLFPGSRIVTVDAATHDRTVAYTLWLTYFINVTYAAVLAKLDVQRLRLLSSPRFEFQAMLVGGCLLDDASLYETLFQENAYATEALTAFRDAEKTLSNAYLRRRGSTSLVASLRKALAPSLGGKKAYARMYELVRA